MFKEPLAIIRTNGTHINQSLYMAHLPKPYNTNRWGKSISFIAKEAARFNMHIPQPERIKRTDTFSRASKTDENIYPELLGDVVEFLAARIVSGKEEAESLYFPQACKQVMDLYGVDEETNRYLTWADLDDDRKQLIIDDLTRLNDIMNTIDNELLTYEGICAACAFIAFWNIERGGRKRFPSDGRDDRQHRDANGNRIYASDVIPDLPCARNIYKMVVRTMNKMKEACEVQSYQFSFPTKLVNSRKNGVNGGRLDFVADNEIWDIKTNTKRVDDKEKLQVLLYLAFMQRVPTKRPVKKCGIVDVRAHETISYNWDELPFILQFQLNALLDYNWEEVSSKWQSGRNSHLTAYQENVLRGKMGIA